MHNYTIAHNIGGAQNCRAGGPEEWALRNLWAHDNDMIVTSGGRHQQLGPPRSRVPLEGPVHSQPLHGSSVTSDAGV
jgi:hypothetical protein